MPIYRSRTTDEQPCVTLERWSIREASTGERYFVGHNVHDRDGRVSTVIQSFDAGTRTGVTASGRRYTLHGRAGYDADAEFVWRWACRNWGVTSWRDVTPELCPDWKESRPSNDVGEAAVVSDQATSVESDEGSPQWQLHAFTGILESADALVFESAGPLESIPLPQYWFPEVLPSILNRLRRIVKEGLSEALRVIPTPYMTLRIELSGDSHSREITGSVRIDLTNDDGVFGASVYVDDRSDLELGPVSLRSGASLPEVLLRLFTT